MKTLLRASLLLAKVLALAAGILLLLAYFGSHVREAGGTAAIAFGQEKPSLAGRWVQISSGESSGNEQVIEQDAASLSVRHGSEGGEHRFVYKLDGSESRNVTPSHGSEIVSTSRASWKNGQLTITQAATYPDGRRLDQTQVWSLDESGRLVIEVTSAMQGRPQTKARLVYARR
jgi:hypothetical protein